MRPTVYVHEVLLTVQLEMFVNINFLYTTKDK